jgi:serine protease
VVAVIDSGVTNHPDLAEQLLRRADGSVYGYDFISKVNNAQDGDARDPNPADPNAGSDWHGTHVSGIIAAAANDQGVVGVAPGARLLELRALGANGGVESDLIAALHWAIGIAVPGTTANEHPAKVINLSLGYVNSCDQATSVAMQNVYAAGVTVITAAGNDSSFASISYPGNCVPTINVGATGYTMDRADYSNFGSAVDISAPGGDQLPNSGAPMLPGSKFAETGLILSSLNDGTESLGNPSYGYEQGTSMAAPFVSGVVALIYAARPDFTPALVWQAIKETATGWNTSTLCFYQAKVTGCGVGIINAGEAVTWALSYAPAALPSNGN